MILFQGHLETGGGGEVPRVSFKVSEVVGRQEWGGIIPVNSTTWVLRWVYCDGDTVAQSFGGR